ncbi:MAG: YihY/virulence factor BrkB family protein, partial [Lachnospiraceae bacterium]|nr:YihY/virulence factor BrkB family protein [Lachnospiraceae bacterium]
MKKAYLLIKRFNRKLRHDDLSAYASSIAFFLFLSLIPLLFLICFLIPYTPLSEADLMVACINIVPKPMNPWIIGLISQIYDRPRGILPMTILVTVWSAGKGMLALMRALNRINDVLEERGYFKLRIISSFYTIVILIVLIVTFVLGVFGRKILKWLVEQTIGIMELRSELISIVSFLVMIILSVIAFCGIYTYIPNKKLEFKNQIPGAVFVASGWSIFTFGFSLYIEYFSSFTAYGTLGAIVLFLLWLYF